MKSYDAFIVYESLSFCSINAQMGCVKLKSWARVSYTIRLSGKSKLVTCCKNRKLKSELSLALRPNPSVLISNHLIKLDCYNKSSFQASNLSFMS